MVHPSRLLRARVRGLKRKFILIGSCGVLAFVGALALPFGGAATSAIGQALRDPLSILDQRSPGARRVGILNKTKRVRAAGRVPGSRGPLGPRQRVLSAVRGAAPAGAPITFADAVIPIPLISFGNVVPDSMVGIPSGSGAPLAGPGGGGGAFVAPPAFGGGGAVAGPGGGGGDSATPPVPDAGTGATAPPDVETGVTPTTPGTGVMPLPPGGGVAPSPGPDVTPTPPESGVPLPPPGAELPLPPGVVTPPVTAVPEPATWLTMMTGFGLVGGALRRRRAGRGSPSPAR